MKCANTVIGILITCCWLQSGFAQGKDIIHMPDSTHIQIMTMVSGLKFRGRVTAITERGAEFTTKRGVMLINREDIVSIEDVPLLPVGAEGSWFPVHNRARLFFTPSAEMLPGGKGYYQNAYLLSSKEHC